MQRLRRVFKTAALGAVLCVTALTVPDASTHPTEVAMVKIKTANGVDLTPDVMWILAVGSDARPGEDMTHTRGDALQLVGINSKTGAATAIGMPRDSWVSIPGVGSNRINAALYYGGPQLLGETVGNLIGVQPDYVIVTRFPYFENMIRDIGGIDVNNPYAFSDSALKPGGFPAGKIHLNGYEAMAFSRIRHTLPAGDFDRSAHQQLTLMGIQAKIAANADRPGFIEKGVLSVMANTATDLSPGELFEIAHALAQVDRHKITHCVVQGSIGAVGAASVVFPDTAMAARFGDRARDDATLESCD
jgi:LCP family protein required for cell wall assembly